MGKLTLDECDVLMKYLYRGLGQPKRDKQYAFGFQAACGSRCCAQVIVRLPWQHCFQEHLRFTAKTPTPKIGSRIPSLFSAAQVHGAAQVAPCGAQAGR